MTNFRPSEGGGNWNTMGSWHQETAGVWALATSTPVAGDVVKLEEGTEGALKFGGSITVTANAEAKEIEFLSTYKKTFKINAVTLTLTGKWDWKASSATLTASQSSTVIFNIAEGSTIKLTSGGKELGRITKEGKGTLELVDDLLTSGKILVKEGGKLNTKGHKVETSAFFEVEGSAEALIFESSTIKLTGTGVLLSATGGSLNAGTSTIELTNTTENTKNITVSNATLYKLIVATDNCTIKGGPIIANALVLNTAGKSVKGTQFEKGQTVVLKAVPGATIETNAKSGERVKLISSKKGETWSIKGSGTYILDYLELEDSKAEEGTWYAGILAHSVDKGNNSGWKFEAPATSQSLTATLSLTGSAGRSTTTQRPATLPMAPTLPRNIATTRSATLPLSGSVGRQIMRNLAAVLNSSAQLSITIPKQVLASLGFAVTLPRQINRSLSASLPLSASAQRTAARALSATLAFAATVERTTSIQLVASLGSSAQLGRTTTRVLGASLPLEAALSRQIARALSAMLSFTGTVGRNPSMLLSASLAMAASLPRTIYKAFAVTLKTIPHFVAAEVGHYFEFLDAELGLLPELSRETTHRLSASLGANAQLGRTIIPNTFQAALGLAAEAVRKPELIFGPSLALNANITRDITRQLSAQLSLQPSITRGRVLSAALGLSGAIQHGLLRVLQATLGLAAKLHIPPPPESGTATLTDVATTRVSLGDELAARVALTHRPA